MWHKFTTVFLHYQYIISKLQIIMAVTNSDAFAKVKAVGSGDVLAGNHVLKVYK